MEGLGGILEVDVLRPPPAHPSEEGANGTPNDQWEDLHWATYQLSCNMHGHNAP